MKKIYVGNLPFSATEAQVRALFTPHGSVYSVALVTQKGGNLPRGFGYVEIDDDALAGALQSVNGSVLDGRKLMVSEARPRIENGRPKRERAQPASRSNLPAEAVPVMDAKPTEEDS